MKKVISALSLAVLICGSFTSAALAVDSSSDKDAELLSYIEQVSTNRKPFLVDKQGMMWFSENTSAKLRQLGDHPVWAVSPGYTNAVRAIESIDDNSLYVNNRYSIPKDPLGDVGDTDLEANHTQIIGADVLQAEGYEGSGKAVAILDTGIQSNHPYFKDDQGNSRIVAQACFVTAANESLPCKNGQDSDLSANSADITHMSNFEQEEMNHGIHVAGIAAGNGNANAGNGIAPDADIVAVRVFGYGGAYDFDILMALDWIATNADLYDIASVNLSLGSGLYSPNTCQSSNSATLEYWYEQFFQNLIDAGVAPLVASGNDGNQTKISSPACIEPAIAVGSSNAYDTNNNSFETISYFTNISSQLDLIAPGNNLKSSLPFSSYGLMSGTSMATPAVVGSFALLQSIDSKPVSEWLAILKNTGTPLDGSNVSNIPRINLDWAACAALDCLVPPRNLNLSANSADEIEFSWQESSYGSTPIEFDIKVGGFETTISATNSSAILLYEDLADVVHIRSRNGSEVSDWAELQPFRKSNSLSMKVKNSNARQILAAELAGDYCTTNFVPYVSFKYESTSANLRQIWISGTNGFASFNETTYTPAVGEALNTDSKTKELIITNPTSLLSSNSKAFVVNDLMYGSEYSLSTLFNEIANGEYSPSAPADLVATGGPSRAILDWAAGDSTSWRVLVDDEVVATVTSSETVVDLTPGQHEVAVCAIKVSGGNTYTSTQTAVSVTASPGIYQEISVDTLPALNAKGAKGFLVASSSANLNLAFASMTSEICSVNAATGQITPLLAGTCEIEMSQSGNGTYAAATSVDVSFEIGVELPGAVRALKATTVSGKLLISWKVPTNHQVAQLTGYRIKWRAKAPGKTFSAWKTITTSSNKTSLLLKKFAKGANVEIKVSAISQAGTGNTVLVKKLIS